MIEISAEFKEEGSDAKWLDRIRRNLKRVKPDEELDGKSRGDLALRKALGKRSSSRSDKAIDKAIKQADSQI